MVGQTLGHYRIVDKLGEGGMGVVYRAEDTTLDREVALKVLPTELAESQERLERFQREAKTLAALDHPNIVHIYTVEEAEGVHFLTMQLVQGKQLSDLIPRGGMPLQRIFDTAIPLADALAAAHAKSVIHRDLKPANIMVTDEGRVKVLDFGLAKLRQEAEVPLATELPTEPLTEEGRIVGTMPYMSPEQLEGKEINARSDIFSLGVLLYEMATGERPFKGDSSASLITAIMSHSPREVDRLRAELPHHLGRIIRHCLEKDPEHRYQSAKDVRNELQDLQREQSLSAAVPVTTEPEPEPPTKRVRWPLVAAAVAGAAIVLAVLVALWPGRSRGPTEETATISAGPAATLEEQPPMIVVLPFENLGDPEDEYFADGMTEEITSRLAAVKSLRVISRTSAMQYKENRPSLKQVGEELGVDYVLEGSVRWARTAEGHGRVRITPQLIRVDDDSHLWADSYDRVIEDVFAVQSEIASSVVEALGISLLEPERQDLQIRPTESLDAYQAYLRGMDNLTDPDYSASKIRRAAEMFNRAIELDPGFALAHAQLSRASSWLYWERWDSSEERRRQAKDSAETALALEPELAQAHLAMGGYHYYGERDYERAVSEFQAAEAQSPGQADIYFLYGAVLRRLGRFDEANTHLQKAVELDPSNPVNHWFLGLNFTVLRRFSAADRSYLHSIELAPDQERAYYLRALNTFLWSGELHQTRRALEAMPSAADPLSVFEWLRLELCKGDFQRAAHYLSLLPPEFTMLSEIRTLRALWEGLLYQLMDEPQNARRSYSSVVRALEDEVADQPELAHLHSNLGWAYAGLGRHAEAIREGLRAVELLPMSKDASAGPAYVEQLAQIYAMVGELDLALDQIEVLLSTPSMLSAPLLAKDPRWDVLRDHPRFQALLERYGQDTPDS